MLLSGTLADHGMAVMIARGDLHLEGDVASDTAPLHELTAALLGLGDALRWMRDPTRGGLATALNELASQASARGAAAGEPRSPSKPTVFAACEILGIDPLYVANEGKLVAVVAAEAADEALALLRGHPLGADAVEIGVVEAEPEGDGAPRHRARRQPDRRPARRRPAPADLLTQARRPRGVPHTVFPHVRAHRLRRRRVG